MFVTTEGIATDVEQQTGCLRSAKLAVAGGRLAARRAVPSGKKAAPANEASARTGATLKHTQMPSVSWCVGLDETSTSKEQGRG